MKTVAVIGGGPAGIMAAISAKEASPGNNAVLFEKNGKLGKKLFITGKGRCNLTNLSDTEDILANVPSNPYFLYSSLYAMDSSSLVRFFNDSGLMTKVERGNRVFPESDKSSDVCKALEYRLKKCGVKVRLNEAVSGIAADAEAVRGVYLKEKRLFKADAVIVATGGLSYPKTGSDGDGYRFAAGAGHNIVKCYPSLAGLKSPDSDVCALAGLCLKNVKATLKIGGTNAERQVYSGFGEVLFTHGGVSGPVILTASRFVTKDLCGGSGTDCSAYIDLKPALEFEELDARILRDFSGNRNKKFRNSLSDLLPVRIIEVIIKKSGIEPDKKVNLITKTERRALVSLLKNFPVRISGTEGFEQAVITCGGVDVNEINPSTMESRLLKGLFFAGEVLDVDAFTGGYNLQIAFSTGYLAGRNV